MAIIRPSGKLIIGGKYFDTDARIVNFRDYPYWDATSESCKGTELEPVPTRCTAAPGGGQYPYNQPPGYTPSTKRYQTRPGLSMSATYEQVRLMIKQFVIHLDNCSTSDLCWRVLHNERGNSCHFLVDNDGTIYQTLDLALMGWHAGAWNTYSIGVEICNWGDAWKNPNFYKGGQFGPDREIKPVRINNHTFKAFDYTPAQYEQMRKLSRALLRIFPNLPAEYPQSSPGQQAWETMPERASHAFSGYIGHFHLTTEKWDPGLWDFKEYCRSLRGEFVFPLFVRPPAPNAPNMPVIPKQASQLKADADLLYAMNEKEADGGFFPVGPWGEHRLWHGGVHLAKKAGEPVHAPFPGRLVAARMGSTSSAGSVNFVLMRHQMSLDADLKVEFYSLYMHLADEPKTGSTVEWMNRESKDKSSWKYKGTPGAVVLLDEPIDAGSVIAHVGTAGPAELSKGQLHHEIFSTSFLFGKVPNSPWRMIDGSGSGRFCDLREVLDAIDTDKNGVLSKQELERYAQGGGSTQNRYMVTQHVTEWTADPSWHEALRASRDYKGLKPADIDQLVNEQIVPGLWWDAATAAHCKLPPDGMVWHYHPITFIAWVNQRLIDAENDPANKQTASLADAKEPPKNVTTDREGLNMRTEELTKEDPCNEKLGLKEMVEGFDGDCKQ